MVDQRQEQSHLLTRILNSNFKASLISTALSSGFPRAQHRYHLSNLEGSRERSAADRIPDSGFKPQIRGYEVIPLYNEENQEDRPPSQTRVLLPVELSAPNPTWEIHRTLQNKADKSSPIIDAAG